MHMDLKVLGTEVRLGEEVGDPDGHWWIENPEQRPAARVCGLSERVEEKGMAWKAWATWRKASQAEECGLVFKPLKIRLPF